VSIAAKHKSNLPRFVHSLRFKMAVGVALPVFILSQLIAVAHGWREQALIDEQTRFIQSQIGATLVGAVEHAMLSNDRVMLDGILRQVTSERGVQRVQIVSVDGEVRFDSLNSGVQSIARREPAGCDECHRLPPGARPLVTMLSNEAGVLRIAVPIANKPECAGCHSTSARHLGVLLADVSVLTLNEHLREDMTVDLSIAAAISLAAAVLTYLMLRYLIVRRIERLHQPLARYAAGDFAQRLPSASDEIGDLADAFNTMAQQLQEQEREQRERAKVRQRAIVEERERIARELHDGMAQLLGYVNTKAMAIRLLLKNHQADQAERQLLQLEDAARSLFVDVREAILGLKMAGQAGSLSAVLRDYAAQYSRSSDIPVEVSIAPEIKTLSLSAEIDLQLLRIVQEALTNIRKHASATRAAITMRVTGAALELIVSDNGQGFDPDRVRRDPSSHFGLSTMRERAEAIGAEFQLESRPNAGTRLTIRLPIQSAMPDSE
jgi:signal transduction histidine kinase